MHTEGTFLLVCVVLCNALGSKRRLLPYENQSRPFISVALIHTIRCRCTFCAVGQQISTGLQRWLTPKAGQACERKKNGHDRRHVCACVCSVPVIVPECGSALSPRHLIGCHHSWPCLRIRQWRIRVYSTFCFRCCPHHNITSSNGPSCWL